jgi:hypothetical protein
VQVATSSTDIDVQMEVAESINEIATTIEALVTTFTALLSDSNPKTQEEFALSARDVGEAINRVCQSTDQTSERKIQRAVQETAMSTKDVVAAASLGKDKLLPVAQLHVERTVKLVKVDFLFCFCCRLLVPPPLSVAFALTSHISRGQRTPTPTASPF